MKLWLWAILLVRDARPLQINDLWVPPYIQNGSTDSAILECDYTLDERDKDSLEIKWYFRYDPTPIVQWIPPNPPQVLNGFQNHVNLHYLATDDPWTEHRALLLQPISTDFSGRYSCRVSSNYEDQILARHMIIYAPPKRTEIEFFWPQSHLLNLTCQVANIYPEPIIHIFLQSDVSRQKLRDFPLSSASTGSPGNSLDVTSTMDSTRLVSWSDGSYSVKVSSLVDLKRIPGFYPPGSSASLTASCSVRLNGTPYHSETVQAIVGEGNGYLYNNGVSSSGGSDVFLRRFLILVLLNSWIFFDINAVSSREIK